MSDQAWAPKIDLAAAASRTARPLPRSSLKMSHLRMIVALEEHEMVSAAADAMSISQPAASRMIAEMETLLNA
jgi:DNA-binding MarR family transcriptional regulator